MRLWLATLILLAVLSGLGTPSLALSDVRVFPETGHTLRGAFRVFWETNGGLDTFGYPISEEFVGSSGRLTQWFERARFELAEGGSQPRVELGNLGLEFTANRIFPKVPPIENSATHRYIPQTQHIIKYGFKEVWETRGAERIFGLPISEEIQEVIEDGQWHTVQYFEKARFEYWPGFPPGRRVLISHLGRRLFVAPPQPEAGSAPAPDPAPVVPPPTPSPPPLPAPTPPPTAAPRENCHSSYPTVCIPPPPPDLKCDDIPHRDFPVVGRDPHRFDGDGDGIGCESR